MAAIVELHPGRNRRPHHDRGRDGRMAPRAVPALDARGRGHAVQPPSQGSLHLVAPPSIGRPAPRRLRWALVAAGALLVVVGAARSVGAVADWAVGAVPPPPPADRQVYVVEPGDTLWSIARSLHPRGDVRPLVDRLIELNGGAELRAGDVLVLRW